MKLGRIALALLLLITMSSLTQGQPPKSRPSPENTRDGKKPEQIVREYFAAYLAWVEYEFDLRTKKVKPKRKVPNKKLDTRYVTQHYIDSYIGLIQENNRTTPPGEVGYLNYDPIICAQDHPANMAKAAVTLSEKTYTEALVKVSLGGAKDEEPLQVRLKKLKDGWRIDAILCHGQDFEAQREQLQRPQENDKGLENQEIK